MTTSTAERLSLGPEDEPTGRMFAHPDHIPSDRSTLWVLLRDVRRRASTAESAPYTAWIPDPSEWFRQVIVPDPPRLAAATDVTVVGFFGRRHDAPDEEVADAIHHYSDRLAAAIPTVPAVLAYTTHLLADERNYANLVLFDSDEGIGEWRRSPDHREAAGTLSPRYYAYVRIYNGAADLGDLTTEAALRLHRVKYWDFRTEPIWQAERELAAST